MKMGSIVLLNLIILLSFSAYLTSCAIVPRTLEARLYSTDGQIIPVNFSYSGSGVGSVWGQFPDGEKFKGEYFTVANNSTSASLFITPWGSITGISASQVGPQVTHITAIGEKGTQIQGLSFPRGSHGFGGCRDSKGREYRLHY